MLCCVQIVAMVALLARRLALRLLDRYSRDYRTQRDFSEGYTTRSESCLLSLAHYVHQCTFHAILALRRRETLHPGSAEPSAFVPQLILEPLPNSKEVKFKVDSVGTAAALPVSKNAAVTLVAGIE